MTQREVSPRIPRREMIIRTAGAFLLFGMGQPLIRKASAQTTTPVVFTPDETEGPYWVDEQLNHSDLATDPTDNSIQPGLALILGITVSQYANGTVTPLPGAYVDLWHCNALGIYSDEAAYNPGGGDGTVTTGQKFLRDIR